MTHEFRAGPSELLGRVVTTYARRILWLIDLVGDVSRVFRALTVKSKPLVAKLKPSLFVNLRPLDVIIQSFDIVFDPASYG